MECVEEFTDDFCETRSPYRVQVQVPHNTVCGGWHTVMFQHMSSFKTNSLQHITIQPPVNGHNRAHITDYEFVLSRYIRLFFEDTYGEYLSKAPTMMQVSYVRFRILADS